MDPNRIICNCQAVTAGAIKEAVDSGADTVEEVQGITGAGTVSYTHLTLPTICSV